MPLLRVVVSVFVFSILLLYGCDSLNPGDTSTHLKMTLVDSPGDYDEVNIEIVEVNIKINNGEWEKVEEFTPGIINLLDLTGGNELLITDQEMNPCTLSQIRLLVGENNNVVLNDGSSYKLKLPSGQDSGMKIILDEPLGGGQDIKIMIDFDAAQSVVKSAGIYLLKPVLRAYNVSETGIISGRVLPADQGVNIQVNTRGKYVASTYAPPGESRFMISGLPEGTYMLIFDPGTESGYQQFAIGEYIEVVKGQTIDVGSVTLESE